MRIVSRSAILAAFLFSDGAIHPSTTSEQDGWIFERQVEALIAHGINQERAQFAPGAPQFNFDPALNGIAARHGLLRKAPERAMKHPIFAGTAATRKILLPLNC